MKLTIFSLKKKKLRVYELKNKVRYIVKKGPQKNNVQRDLSTCVENLFNGFEIVKSLKEEEIRNLFFLIDIIH